MVEKINETELKSLAKIVARGASKPNATYSFQGEDFSYDVLNETFRKQLNAYACDWKTFRRNKTMLFELIEETFDDVLPIKVNEQWGKFAEVKTYGQGDRAIFTQKVTTASKRRAKQFITKVGLAGIYEVFKLDGRNYEVPTSAFGGAAQIGLEEFLDGRADFASVFDIVMEGLDEVIYVEIEKALKAGVKDLPSANKVSAAGFVETSFDNLLFIADSYGTKSTIYCTFEFAAKMLPQTGWISDAMRDQKWANGYLGNYKGHSVVILPQSLVDEKNNQKVIDPGYCWIIPSGPNDKPVKIAFEGDTIVDEYTNKDRSREVQVYKKVGVGAILTPNICVYKDTAIAFNDSNLP